jgi:GNAT superfamily N-acetyltransferase
MTNGRDPRHFRQPIVLRDGTPAVIRAIRPDDVDKVVAAFHKLEPESIYTRFFSYRKELTAAELDRLGGADFVHAIVLVVAVGTGADETLIGGASYNVHTGADGAKVAEVSFTIEEDYQGQGLSSRLLLLLADIARSQGISHFEAEVLPGNSLMLSVFQHSGLPMTMTKHESVVHVLMDLAENPPRKTVPGQPGI